MTQAFFREQVKRSIDQLWSLEEDELLRELGQRLEVSRIEVDEGKELSAMIPAGPTEDSATLMGPPLRLRDIAERFFRRFNRELHSLVCNAEDPDNAKIIEILNKGGESLGLVIAGALMASFGWLPGIAAVVAVLIAKKLLKASHATVCDEWEKTIKI